MPNGCVLSVEQKRPTVTVFLVSSFVELFLY